ASLLGMIASVVPPGITAHEQTKVLDHETAHRRWFDNDDGVAESKNPRQKRLFVRHGKAKANRSFRGPVNSRMRADEAECVPCLADVNIDRDLCWASRRSSVTRRRTGNEWGEPQFVFGAKALWQVVRARLAEFWHIFDPVHTKGPQRVGLSGGRF